MFTKNAMRLKKSGAAKKLLLIASMMCRSMVEKITF